jgi:hypothetical protein
MFSFSPPSFDMCKEEGKRVSFFRKTFFFIIEWLGKGGQGFFKKYMLKGGREGEGVDFFLGLV